MAWVGSWHAAAALWHGKDYHRIGISDSGFSFHLADLIAEYAPRILVIERPAAEVNASLARIGIGGSNYCDLVGEALIPWTGHPLVRRIAFASLVDDNVVRSCLWHLMPGVAVDMGKLALFQRLNVQADMGTVWSDVAARGRNLGEIIGEKAAAAVERR